MVSTPNLDAFAASSVVFDYAYANYPYCSPSRNSFLSGRTPDETRVWNFQDDFRATTTALGTSWTSMPEHFKRHGWWTAGAGKVFHQQRPRDNDSPRSWSVPFPTDIGDGCDCPMNPEAADMGCELPDDGPPCFDEQYTTTVVHLLHSHADATSSLTPSERSRVPFFIALGLHKPHLPWAAPRRFYERYPEEEDLSAIEVAAHPDVPAGAPPIAFHQNTWKHFPHAFRPGQPVSSAIARAARRAYYACVSFADASVGRALDAVDAIGRRGDTVVLVTSDHGFQLGEHNEWGKQTLYELSLRVPLLIRDPSLPPNILPSSSSALRSSAFFELIDIYRTLAELAGTPEPEAGVRGHSHAPALRAARTGTSDAGATVGPRHAAFAQMARCIPPAPGESIFTTSDACTATPREQIGFMGYTVRTRAWRYTQWVRFSFREALAASDPEGRSYANWSAVNASELYEHNASAPDDGFDATENVNLAGRAELAHVEADLRELLLGRFGPGPPGELQSPQPDLTATPNEASINLRADGSMGMLLLTVLIMLAGVAALLCRRRRQSSSGQGLGRGLRRLTDGDEKVETFGG